MTLVLVSGAGGPAAANFINSLRDEIPVTVWGMDMNKYLIHLAPVHRKFIVPSVRNTTAWIRAIHAIEKSYGKIDMFVPITDIEIYYASRLRKLLPPMTLPIHRVINTCRNKDALYRFLKKRHLRVPEFTVFSGYDRIDIIGKNYPDLPDFPLWLRATQGAGGHLAYRVNNCNDIRHILSYYSFKENTKWIVSKYLEGDNYCWTSIWKDGELITSVTKKRLQWVYNRIGTTAVQVTVHRPEINEMCKRVVQSLDDKLSGIMMVDLKCDECDLPYITEINAGRLGTVNRYFASASYKYYGDGRVNFAYLLHQIHMNDDLPTGMKKFDALPVGMYWIRHIDMGHKLVTQEWLDRFENGGG